LLSGTHRKVLELLMRDGGFVSSSRIASELGISKASVSRIVKELIGYGFVIEVNPKLGYRVEVVDDVRYVGKVLKNMNIHYLDRCTSTQDIADMLASQGAPEGTVVICEEMSYGRGRLGRKWVAGRGGLWFTIVLKPKIIKSLQLLTLIAGTSVVKSIKELYNLDVSVKWPNDVLLGGRKLCGVLIEARLEADSVNYVLVGIGVNVNNELPEELRGTAVTLAEVLGCKVPRVPILKGVITNLFNLYNELLRGNVELVISEWRRYNSTIGKKVKVVSFNEVFEGTALDVDVDGSLIVRTEGGVKKVSVGDVVHLS